MGPTGVGKSTVSSFPSGECPFVNLNTNYAFFSIQHNITKSHIRFSNHGFSLI